MAHKKTNVSGDGDSLPEKLPENIFFKVLSKVGDETEILTTLCMLTCVSQNLHSIVKKQLSSLSSLNFSAFSIDSNTFNGITKRLGKMKKITLDCLRLNDFSIRSLLGTHVEELVLLKCSSLSQDNVLDIARVCPNLRVLKVELSGFTESLRQFDDNLKCLYWNCPNLETLHITVVNGKRHGSRDYMYGRRHLTSLSLVRNQQRLIDNPFRHVTAIPFTYVTDMGMTMLSEGCKRLESVRLDWFSEVTNAGFMSILNSCLNLKKFEIQNSSRLTGLALKNVSKAHRPLVEVKLVCCKSITCKGVGRLAKAGNLVEVLNLHGCQRVADSCLRRVSYLMALTSLNLGNTNVTEAGMDVLGKGNAPISYLSLRGCKAVTDEGIKSLLGSEGKIRNTLSSLDLGYMQRISDNAITIIADACAGLVQLCLRNCLLVTDEAVKTLAFRERLQHESKLLRRLDMCKCPGVSVESFEFLMKPLFRGLQWIGIGETRLIRVGDDRLSEINRERPWLTICTNSCEVGWQNHKF